MPAPIQQLEIGPCQRVRGHGSGNRGREFRVDGRLDGLRGPEVVEDGKDAGLVECAVGFSHAPEVRGEGGAGGAGGNCEGWGEG